jgi:hypothetical protein
VQEAAISVSADNKGVVVNERSPERKNADLEIGVPGLEAHLYPGENIRQK